MGENIFILLSYLYYHAQNTSTFRLHKKHIKVFKKWRVRFVLFNVEIKLNEKINDYEKIKILRRVFSREFCVEERNLVRNNFFFQYFVNSERKRNTKFLERNFPYKIREVPHFLK